MYYILIIFVLIIYESDGWSRQEDDDQITWTKKAKLPAKEMKIDSGTYSKTAYLISLVNRLEEQEQLRLVNKLRRAAVIWEDPNYLFNYNMKYFGPGNHSGQLDMKKMFYDLLIDVNHNGIKGTKGATMPPTTPFKKKRKWRRHMPRAIYFENPDVLTEFRRMRWRKDYVTTASQPQSKASNSDEGEDEDDDEDGRRAADALFRVEKPSNEAQALGVTENPFEVAFKGLFDNQETETKQEPNVNWDSKEKDKDDMEKTVFNWDTPTGVTKGEDRAKDGVWDAGLKTEDKKLWGGDGKTTDLGEDAKKSDLGDVKTQDWTKKKVSYDRTTKNSEDNKYNDDRHKKKYEDDRLKNDWDTSRTKKDLDEHRPKNNWDDDKPKKDWAENKPSWVSQDDKWNNNDKRGNTNKDDWNNDEQRKMERNKKRWDDDSDKKRDRSNEWNKKKNNIDWDDKKTDIGRDRDKDRNQDWDKPKKKWKDDDYERKKKDWDLPMDHGDNKQKDDMDTKKSRDYGKSQNIDSSEKTKKKINDRDNWDRPMKNFADDPSLEKDGPRRIRKKQEDDDYGTKKRNDWNPKYDWDKNDDFNSKKKFDDVTTNKYDDYSPKKKKDDWNDKKSNEHDWYSKKKKDYDDYDKPKKQSNWDDEPKKKKSSWDDEPKKKKSSWDDEPKAKKDNWDDEPKKKKSIWDDEPKPKQDNWDDEPKTTQSSWDDEPKKKKNSWDDEPKPTQNNWQEDYKPKQDNWDDQPKPKHNWDDDPPTTRKRKHDYDEYDYHRPKRPNNHGHDTFGKSFVRTPIPYRGKKGIYEDPE